MPRSALVRHDRRRDHRSDDASATKVLDGFGHHARLQRLEAIAELLDSRFRIPGTGWRFGLDSLAGLIPGIGDTVTAAISAYVVFEAHRLGVPKRLLAKMIANVGVDYVVGSVPLLGDIFDVVYKSNRRNVDLLLRHLREQAGRS